MCGIAGIIDRGGKRLNADSLRRMGDVVVHRGPDDWGLALWAADGSGVAVGAETTTLPEGYFLTGLVHRRLSIIDLTKAGHQPMHDPTRRYWLVFNGEVYNYIEIREELIARGHAFRTRTDTEVVLTALIEWGEHAFEKFNGMWALALYDSVEGTLFLSRDRFGIKPLYVYREPGYFVFGSELRQVLAAPSVSSKANHRILADFLLWRYEEHSTDTFFEGIHTLPAGTSTRLTLDDIDHARWSPRRYWEPRITSPLGMKDAEDGFRHLLRDSVRLRLRSDVPVGVTLSGGLDSSSIACLAAGILKEDGGGPLHTFTSVYEDPGYSEQHYADVVNSHIGAQATMIRPNAERIREDWEPFVTSMEEPFSTLSFYSNWKVYQQIRAHGVPVVLSGQGGDELLLGYDRYRIAYLNILMRKGEYGAMAREMLAMRRNANMSPVRQLLYLQYFRFPRVRTSRRRRLMKGLLRADFQRRHEGEDAHVRAEYGYTTRRELQENEMYRYQLPQLLHHEDRESMHHSIETRLPFLDYRLFEFMLSQSDEAVIHGGWSKRILRNALTEVVPAAILRRTDKMGFETPTARLLRDNKDFFLDLLMRHHEDPVVDSVETARRFRNNALGETESFSIISYLSWKDAFHVHI